MIKWRAAAPAALAALLSLGSLARPQSSAEPFLGRWDITVTAGSRVYPDWLEVTSADGRMSARVQPESGSVHGVTNVAIENGHLKFTLSAAIKNRPAVTWDVTVAGGKLTGVENRGSSEAQLSGVRAPLLKRDPPAQWGAPEPLFDGKDLAGWEPIGSAQSNWAADNGVLVNRDHGANLRTTSKFDDFKLHIEYNCPDDCNSGVYLRGRYEVQIEYEPVGRNDRFHEMGAVYGFLAPAVELPRKPGEWETYEITLVGRNVTVARDGVTTIDRQEIPGITGGALDADEAAPGPFYLQGDHHGLLQFRNITISLPKR